ncbi:MAG: hypothetical protein KDE26_25395, partial [Bacteroidetes bacterium]|nr:hypothetical protein [Bacteroidota bacterium]
YGINKVMIPPESNQLISFHFQPVNSYPLHRKIDYHGDLKKRYYFPLSCIQAQSGLILSQESLRFYLSDSLYENYLTNWGKESSTRLYKFDLKETFFNGYSPLSPPEVRDEEIHLQNIHLRFQLWHFSDTLTCEWKITNQSEEAVYINPKQVLIENEGQILAPLPAKHKAEVSNLIDGKWVIRPGGKFQYRFRFKPEGILNNPVLSTSGILVGEKRKPLFYEDISFLIDSISPL